MVKSGHSPGVEQVLALVAFQTQTQNCRVLATAATQFPKSSGAWQGAPDGVATLEVRKGASHALNKGSGALGKVK